MTAREVTAYRKKAAMSVYWHNWAMIQNSNNQVRREMDPGES